MERTIIVPMYKKRDTDRCEKYRGVALGNTAYKILANIILEKKKLNHILKKLPGIIRMDSEMEDL
jgi:hypothetical protein